MNATDFLKPFIKNYDDDTASGWDYIVPKDLEPALEKFIEKAKRFDKLQQISKIQDQALKNLELIDINPNLTAEEVQIRVSNFAKQQREICKALLPK